MNVFATEKRQNRIKFKIVIFLRLFCLYAKIRVLGELVSLYQSVRVNSQLNTFRCVYQSVRINSQGSTFRCGCFRFVQTSVTIVT